jgi:hypothetical protein
MHFLNILTWHSKTTLKGRPILYSIFLLQKPPVIKKNDFFPSFRNGRSVDSQSNICRNPDSSTQLGCRHQRIHNNLLSGSFQRYLSLSYNKDFSQSALEDFLESFLGEEGELSAEALSSLCSRLSGLLISSGEESVDDSMQARKLDDLDRGKMQNLIQDSNSASASVDLTHVAGRVGKSIVDEKKLEKQEKKLAKKRAAQGKYFDADGIPIWNPAIKPDMIVNQVIPTGAVTNGLKDVKIDDFDLSFAGNRILTNANLALSYGRRYGVVGRNGIILF